MKRELSVKSQPRSGRIPGGWLRALYSILLSFALPFIYLYLWWHGRNNPGYRQRWSERGCWQKVPQSARGSWVFHCVSVGELMAAKPLIDLCLSLNPQQPVTVTCTTPTGSELVQRWYGERVYHCYLPFDTPLAVRRFLSRVQPRGFVILETELWPNLVAQCHQHGIPVALANARMSARSARGYHKARALMKPVWQALSLVIAQNEDSSERFKALGCQPERVQALGNIKFDVQISQAVQAAVAEFKPQLGGRQVITVGSTHEGEERIALDAFKQTLQARPDSLLILVPRHQERFDEVARLVAVSGLRMQRRSDQQALAADTQVLLADSMGEMLLWFGVSTIATIGGSLIERGGHNPLEAMAFGLPIVSGRHVFNFADVYSQLDARQAVRWVDDTQSLHETWLGLLVEPATAQRLGAQAQQLFARHRGATERSLAALTGLLARSEPGRKRAQKDSAQ
ncbi:3-deoxy-D-manno-octulosonic acid transferase [Aliidiomarina sedimenti]|uniref:3-deoxy-D-manno-octulosonic acid transferase n=1 Tax=Aliidiomarina sedimenti TaxID=1933879 RepID=A0ABY0C223_9GAMM|nr:3-deoxy-D-manno-octulosonic acid transferase [Aliidiomarina sedimenti]